MTPQSTITDSTDSHTAVLFAVLGGSFRIRLRDCKRDSYGRRSGDVLDDAGNVIGYAHDLIYGASGFTVETRPFAGYVPNDKVVFV